MSGEQARLDGSTVDATPLDGDGPKCTHRDDDGERCGFYAVVAVELAEGGKILACSTHAKQSWLDSAGVQDA
jgi:hypothetical protein